MNKNMLVVAGTGLLCALALSAKLGLQQDMRRKARSPSQEVSSELALDRDGFRSGELARRTVAVVVRQAAQMAPPRPEEGNEAEEARVQGGDNAMRAFQDHMEDLEAAFVGESVDPNWAGRMSRTLRDAIDEDAELAAAVRAVECRTSACRVEIGLDEAMDFQACVPPLLYRIGASLPKVEAHAADDERGRKTLILYFRS